VNWQIVFAGIGGAVMVIVGAYASHAGVGSVAHLWLEIGVRYGLWHCLALVGTAALARGAPSRWLTVSATAFAAGVFLFSGSLFIRVLLHWSWVAPATPLGGLSFIAGWLLLAIHGIRSLEKSRANST
jgi:uncharacterized membrane protein YgdD (TMEM256/DUF423 family)